MPGWDDPQHRNRLSRRAQATKLSGPELGRVNGLRLAGSTADSHVGDIQLKNQEPIAIVGMGCRFPGGITSPQEYWDFMLAGRDAWREVPPQRWESYSATSPEHARAV